MAVANNKTNCVTCGKEKVAYKCEGCSQHFCFNHLVEHRQVLEKQLDKVEDEHNLLQKKLIEQKTNPQNHLLIQKIDEWERDSIKTIQQTADESRQLLMEHITGHNDNMEVELSKFTEQLKHIREENDLDEVILNEFKQKLRHLEEQLIKPPNVSIKQNSSSFIKKKSVVISSTPVWIQNGITVAGGNGPGNSPNQLWSPYGVYVDDDQTVYVADSWNHRIVEWKKDATSGEVVAGGNGYGSQNNQLNEPTSVIVNKKRDCLIISDYGNQRIVLWPRQNGSNGQTIISNVNCYCLFMDNDEYIYVSDISKHEVSRWRIGDRDGVVVAGGNGAGNRLDQLHYPIGIFVDQDYSVYVSDGINHRVMKWMKDAEEGIVVAGGQGQGNGLTELYNPRGVIVDQQGTVYIADQGNERVMCWVEGATQGSVVVGDNGEGVQSNQFYGPVGLSFDRQNNLYVVDNNNHRVQKFETEQNLN